MTRLTIYSTGVAILTRGGEQVWASDEDEEFLQDFDELLTVDDADDVLGYLEAAGHLEEGEECEIEEAHGDPDDDDDADDFDPDEDLDEDEDEDEDEGGGFFE